MYQGITRKSKNSLKNIHFGWNFSYLLEEVRTYPFSALGSVRFRELSEAFMLNLGNVNSMHLDQTNHKRRTNHFKSHGQDTFSREKTKNRHPRRKPPEKCLKSELIRKLFKFASCRKTESLSASQPWFAFFIVRSKITPSQDEAGFYLFNFLWIYQIKPTF